MQMRSIRGKNIVSAGYDPVTGTLRTRFNKSGEYDYMGVPEEKFVSLCRVPYPDKYFTQVIKGRFTCIKVVDEPIPPPQPAPRKETTMEFYRAEDGLTFEPEGHKYTLDGKSLMSLTQILDAAGLVDYSGIDAAVLANKATFGTKVHEYTCWYDQGELELVDVEKIKASKYGARFTGWLQFLEDFHFTPDLNWCEVPCAVKVNSMTYAMTIDRFGVFGTDEEVANGKGSFGVVEIKTCADREPSHQIQTAGQAIPFRGDGSVPVKRMAVYLLEKPNGSGGNYFCQPHEDRMDEKIFLASLMLTQFRLNNKLLKGL
jgi:hypothetical protein